MGSGQRCTRYASAPGTHRVLGGHRVPSYSISNASCSATAIPCLPTSSAPRPVIDRACPEPLHTTPARTAASGTYTVRRTARPPRTACRWCRPGSPCGRGEMSRTSPRVTVRAGRDESDVAPGLTGATSESSSHRLPSVKSAPCRSVSASANDHRLLTQTCDASPYRGMLRVGAWCSNRGTPAGRTKLLLRFGLGLPVFPCTRSTPCRPHWQGPSCAGSRTRLRTSFALFSALMAGTRLRGGHGCRGVVRGRVGEEGVVIGGLRRAGAWRRAGSSRVTGNRLRCAAIETPTHRTSWCDPPCPDRVEPSYAVQDRPRAGCRHGHPPVPGVGASSRDGYLRSPLPQ